MSSSNTSRDMKRYPKMEPWHGAMGVAFERHFLPDMEAVWRAESDDFADLHEHMHGRDPGGVPPPTAADIAANANAVGAMTAGDAPGDAPRKHGARRRNATKGTATGGTKCLAGFALKPRPTRCEDRNVHVLRRFGCPAAHCV